MLYITIRVKENELCAWCDKIIQKDEEALETENKKHYCSINCVRGGTRE